jgi:hypothetical protein
MLFSGAVYPFSKGRVMMLGSPTALGSVKRKVQVQISVMDGDEVP